MGDDPCYRELIGGGSKVIVGFFRPSFHNITGNVGSLSEFFDSRKGVRRASEGPAFMGSCYGLRLRRETAASLPTAFAAARVLTTLQILLAMGTGVHVFRGLVCMPTWYRQRQLPANDPQ